MNQLTELYRKHFPEDDRPDDAITLELSKDLPEAFTQLPDAAADLERINKAIAEATKPSPMDYVRQATGSLIRGGVNMAADIPQDIAIVAHKLEQVLPLPGADKEKPVEEYPTYRAGQAIRRFAEKISPEPVPELQGSFAATKVPQGIGSALAFMAGGAAGKLLKIPEVVGIAGLGAASQASEGYQDAKAHGATDDQAWKSFVLNAGIGTSEAFPLAHMLKRLEGMSGGTLSKALAIAAGETVEEALQEGFQSGAGDVIAKNFAKYDPDRKLYQSMKEDAAAGGVTGFLFSLLTQAIGHHVGGHAERQAGKGEETPGNLTATPSSAQPATPTPNIETQVDAAATIDAAKDYELAKETKSRIRTLARREADGDTSVELHTAIASLYDDREARALYLAEKSKAQEQKRIIDQALAEPAVPETAEPTQPVAAAAPIVPEAAVPEPMAPAAEAVPDYLQRARQVAAEYALAPDAVTQQDVTRERNPLADNQTQADQGASAGHDTQVSDSQASKEPEPPGNVQRDLDRLIEHYKAEQAKASEKIEGGQTTEAVRRGNKVANVDLINRLDFVTRRLARLQDRKARGLPPGVQFDVADLDFETVGADAYRSVPTDVVMTPAQLGEQLTQQSTPSSGLGLSKNNTHRLTTFVAPGGQVVVVGTFKQNASLVKKGASGYQVADPARPGKSMPLEDLMAQGFTPVASMRTIDPLNNPVFTYANMDAYRRDFGDAPTMANAARATTAAVAEQVRKGGATQETAVDPEAVELASQLEDAAKQVVEPELAPNLTVNDVRFSPELAGELYDSVESIADGPTATLDQALSALFEVAKAGGKEAQDNGRATKSAIALSKELGRIMQALQNTREDYAEIVGRRIQKTYNQSGSREAFSGVLSLQARQANTAAVSGSATDSGRAPDAGQTERGGAAEAAAARVAGAAAQTDVAPTDAEKQSGDYDKGTVDIDGLEVVIETPKGAIRSSKNPARPWAVVMPAMYGYVEGTRGRDGDAVDVFIGPDPEAPNVWVIDQIDPRTKKFDEHKAMLGFHSREEAMAAYIGGFSDGLGGQRIGEMTVMPKQDFVDWVNEGDTEGPLAYGKPAKALKFRRGTQHTEFGADPIQLKAMWEQGLDAARAQGLDIALLRNRVGNLIAEGGEWRPGQVALSVADALNPTEDNLVLLFHEIGHEVFAGLDPEVQARLHRALERVRPGLPPAGGGEEQLVEMVATEMVREGFNAQEAQGFVQKLLRLLKDIYLRAVMALQEARFGRSSSLISLAYFQNRVESYLARDFSAMPLGAFLGGPKFRDVGYVEDEFAEPSADVNSPALAAPHVAKHNAVQDTLKVLYDTWTSLGHNTGGLTLEQFLRSGNFVQLEELPAESIAQINEHLAAVGASVDPATRIASLPSESFKQRAAVMAQRILSGVWTALNTRRRSAEYALSATNKSNLIDRLTRSNARLHDITTKYTDADIMLREARATIETLLGEFRQDVKQVKSLARKAGTLTQTIREVEGRMDRPLMRQYEVALNRVWLRFAGAEGGQKFSDLLQRVAEVPGIDWENETSAVIREKLVDAAMADPLLEQIVAPELDNRALLSVLVAFGRSNANVLDMLQVRRSNAVAERAVFNAALTKAMEDSKDAIAQAKGMVSSLPRLARVADRLLTRLEKIKADNHQLLDEMTRERAFIDFHQSTAGVLRTEMAKLEHIFGASGAEWEPVHGAKYMVPPHPNASIDQVEASTKVFSLQANGMNTADVRADMAKMKTWMDGVLPQNQGSTWNNLNRQYDRLAMNDLDFAHNEIQHGFATAVFAPLTDRLKSVGTPAARSAAKRIETMQFWLSSLQRRGHELGTKWAVAEGLALQAVGFFRVEDLRNSFYYPALSFIEKRQDILAGHANVEAAENAVLRELHQFFMRDPESARILSKPGAWLAVEQYLRQTARTASWLDANRKEMGLKIKDAGPESTIYRESIGAPPFTVLRRLSQAVEKLHKAMAPTWQGAEWDAAKIAEEYRADPAALRDRLKDIFTSDVWQEFVSPIAHRTGRSSFYAPMRQNGTQAMALRERVVKAFESAGGDAVDFAEHLFALEGGGQDRAAFVGETLSTFGSFFKALHSTFQDSAKAEHYKLQVPKRYLMDARKSEEFPAEWLDYMPYDPHAMRQLVKMQAFEKGFGRDMAAMEQDFKAARDEQDAFDVRYNKLRSRFPDKKGRGFKDAMKAEAARLGWDFAACENAQHNLTTLDKGQKQFNALLQVNQDRPIEIQPWAEMVSALTAATVQGPGTAFTDTISVLEQPFRKFGLSTEALKQIMVTGKATWQVAWGSLMQAVGRTAYENSQHMRLLYEIGHYDDDATLTLKEKMRALVSDHTPATGLLKAGVMAARGIRAAVSTGIGRAQPGAPVVYPTVKPHAPFTQQAQTIHAAEIIGWWRTYEELVGKAIKYFQAHPADMTDPAFTLQPQHLGYKPGFLSGMRPWEYLQESLARYGLSLDQEARSAIDRRAVDPNAPLLTKEAYRAIAAHGQNEMTLESSITTRPPGFITNPVLQMVNPLLGWALSKSHDAWRSFREPNGERSLKAFKQGLWAYAAILPIGLAYALMRDEYDEEIVGKKQNVMRITSDNPFLAMLDNMSRVGTLGLAGEFVNSLLNVDTQREVSVDSRVFFVSTLLNLKRTTETFIKQGEADWQTVYRPLMQGLGGSGFLQYVDILNNALGLDNEESRVAKRISVNNYLRSAGRALDLDVRTGRGMAAIPNPIKPYVGEMLLAAMANDPVAFREAHREAVLAARDEKKPDPEDYVKRSFAAYHPLKLVFRTEPSEDEYRRLLFQMDDDGRQTVSTAIRLFNGYAGQLGIQPNVGKAPAKAKADALGFRSPGMTLNPPTLNDARRKAALFGY